MLLVALGTAAPPGHEQAGNRPVVVVSQPPAPVRYPVLLIVPVTSQVGIWADANPGLYPRLPGGAGIRSGSAALCDQVRSCDARRVLRYLGSLPPETFATILQGVAAALRLV